MSDPLGLFEEEGKGSDPLGLFDEEDKKPSFLDKAIGAGETALSFGTGMVAQVPAAIGGVLSGINDLTQGNVPKSVVPTFEGITRGLTYEPRTAEGKDMLDDLSRSGAMQSLNAVGGHVIPPILTKPRMPKAGERAPVDVSVLKEAPPAKDPLGLFGEQMELPLETTAQQIAERRGAEVGQRDMFGPVNEELGRPDMGQPIGPKPVPEPIDAMRQHELFDQPSQGRVANPYEAVTGDWRIDENGMPIKADLSMDVANASDPLQRNLWGDELPRKHQQEALPLTEAIDACPSG